MAGRPRRTWTAEETREHMAALRQLLPMVRSEQEALRAVRAQFGFGYGRLRRLTQRVREEWEREEEERRPHYRREQVQRLMQMLAAARGKRTPDGRAWLEKPNHSAVVRYESLLADLLGTREPLKVSIDARLNHTVAAVIYGMPAERVAESLAQYRENVRLAHEYREAVEKATPQAAGRGIRGV